MTVRREPNVVKAGSSLSQDYCAKDVSEMRLLCMGGGNLEEKFCHATAAIVKKCAREKIWGNCKFLTDEVIRQIEVEKMDKVENGGVLDILLRETGRKKLDSVTEMVYFWKVYSSVLQKELNRIKSQVHSKIRDHMLKGEYLYENY